MLLHGRSDTLRKPARATMVGPRRPVSTLRAPHRQGDCPSMNLARLMIAAATLALTLTATQRQVSAGAVFVAKENTLNGTDHNAKTTNIHKNSISAANALGRSLSLSFANNLGGGPLNAYVMGLDSNNRVVFVAGDGTLIYPSSGGSGVPVPIETDVSIPLPALGNALNMTVPIPIASGRIYFSQGTLSFFMVKTANGDGLVQPSVTNLEDPNAGINWGFVEFTYTTDLALWANLSYVDFVGLPLGLILTDRNGATQVVKGLGADSVLRICEGLVNQAKQDYTPWAGMCIADSAGTPLRVLSPYSYAVLYGIAFQDYWSRYVDQVWAAYGETILSINTQSSVGTVACMVVNGQLTCAGDNRGYAKPTANDIWGCNSGPFAIQAGDNNVHRAVVPRLCAAFVRSTLLLAGGSLQPGLGSGSYYTVSPTNHYSRLVHELEVDGKGYTFPYDNVSPDDATNASGVVASSAPGTLTVYVGAPPP